MRCTGPGNETPQQRSVPMGVPADEAYLLVWDSQEDTARVYTADEALGLDGDRFRAEFVFDTRAEAEEYADDAYA